MIPFLHFSALSIADTVTALGLLVGVFLLTVSWWRTYGRLARFLRRLIEVGGLLLLRQVLLFIGGESFSYWPSIDAGLMALAAVLFGLSQVTLFAIIRNLSTEDQK